MQNLFSFSGKVITTIELLKPVLCPQLNFVGKTRVNLLALKSVKILI